VVKFRDLTDFPEPWLLYLKTDPINEPTSHARGTVFYIGIAPARRDRAAATGLPSIDLVSE